MSSMEKKPTEAPGAPRRATHGLASYSGSSVKETRIVSPGAWGHRQIHSIWFGTSYIYIGKQKYIQNI